MRKINKLFLIALCLVFGLSVVRGQDEPKKEEPKKKNSLFFYDKGAKKEEPSKTEEPSKAEEPSKTKEPSLAPKKEEPNALPKKIKPEKKMSQEEIDEQISKNEDVTIKKYRDILDSEKYEVKNLQARVATNEKLVEDYTNKLREAEKRLEMVRVELTTKAILLKKSRDDGRISNAEFNKEFKNINERLKLESSELSADVEFFRKELARAKSRLSRLKDELRVKEEARKVATDYEKKHGGKGKFTNAEFEKVYRQFKALLPRKLKPVYENNPFKSPLLKK